MLTRCTTTEPVTEVIHGTTVVDPYRWLEDRSLAETESWLQTQKRICDTYFSRIPEMNFIRSSVERYLDVENIDQPAKAGARYFFRRRAKGQQQACIWARDVLSGKEQVLVDPSGDGPYTSVHIHWISEDGHLLAYGIKHGGEREESVGFVDVEGRERFPDILDSGIFRGVAFSPDNKGVYYCREDGPRVDLGMPHNVFYHRFGSASKSDEILLRMERTSRSRLILSSDFVQLGALYVYDAADQLTLSFYTALKSQPHSWRTVIDHHATPYAPFLWGGKLYAQTFAASPNGSIVELDDDGIEGSTVVPASQRQIGLIHLAVDHIFVSYKEDQTVEIQCWSRKGEFVRSLQIPKGGTFFLCRKYTASSNTLFFAHESFAHPPEILESSSLDTSYTPWLSSPYRSVDLRIERVSYSSHDGTKIPMWLVMRRDLALSKETPIVLTGYGAAGISMTPRFSVLITILVEFGFVFALPNIRGGSEFGREWHLAAQKRKHQVAFDDFIAAAEWLCEEALTNPLKLSAFGGSFSGLLVGVAMTQRPDLFRAILCLAPILDMIRYEQFGDAKKWREEYGTINDPEDFHALLSYSPYHRLSQDQKYPSALFVAGDKDGQCDPLHARKMVARLQDLAIAPKSIILDYSAERGHAPVLPLSERVEALARRVAFLCFELNVNISQEK